MQGKLLTISFILLFSVVYVRMHTCVHVIESNLFVYAVTYFLSKLGGREGGGGREGRGGGGGRHTHYSVSKQKPYRN